MHCNWLSAAFWCIYYSFQKQEKPKLLTEAKKDRYNIFHQYIRNFTYEDAYSSRNLSEDSQQVVFVLSILVHGCEHDRGFALLLFTAFSIVHKMFRTNKAHDGKRKSNSISD